METKFNFNSQVCTSRSQSERLLALGLKKETADCHWAYHSVTATRYAVAHPCDGVGECIPAWSLHRLLCLIPKEIELSFGKWVCININYDYNIIYLNDNQDDFVGFYEGSIYNKAYVGNVVKVSDKTFKKFLPLIEKIKNFKPYDAVSKGGFEYTHDANFPVDDCCRYDLGEKDPCELYDIDEATLE